MRILFITPYLPNTLRTRPHHFLKELAPRHRITLLSPVFNQEEAAQAQKLQALLPEIKVQVVNCPRLGAVWHSLMALPRGLPMQSRYCYHPALVKAALSLVQSEQIELIHIEHFRAAYLGECLAELSQPRFYDAVDSISLLVERTLKHGPLKNRLVSLFELGATRRYEAYLTRNPYFQAMCATSQEDATTLEVLGGGEAGPVQVVPNGVDINYFSPPAADEAREAATVVFSGKMSYHANVAAARYLIKEIWPLVRAECPEAKLWIVGNQPPRNLRTLSGKQGVEVLGYVPDLRAYLRRATVAVAPMLYSVGIQNKVLEALACATPTVASPSVCRAIAAHDRQELHLAAPERPVEFAGRIVELIQQPQSAAEIGARGRALVAERYTWTNAARQLEQLWISAMINKPEPVLV